MSIISVIVPVYKVEQYITRCIDSILAQTFSDFELILVDDGSPDRCGIICEEYAAKDKRIHVIHRENGGLSAARNTGLDWVFDNSDNQWIAFVDSDDWIHPQYLELLYNAVINEATLIGICRFVKVSSANGVDYALLNPQTMVIDSIEAYTHGGKGIYAYTWDKLYKKELWKDVRFPVGRNWEDTVTTYKTVLSVQKIVFVDANLYFYFINENGIVQQDWTPKKMDHLWAIKEAMKAEEIKKRSELVFLFRRQQLNTLIEQLDQVNKTNELTKSEKDKYSAKLRRELRILLLQHEKSLKLSKTTRNWVRDLAFPRLSWLYWTSIGVFGKIKKLVK